MLNYKGLFLAIGLVTLIDVGVIGAVLYYSNLDPIPLEQTLPGK